ncbi:MAG TPA: alpha/beta hydrolase [Dehalococcoidia bacterium]|nr:alpha/beta hydrolase [Dehalococcoidia bacterium]
MPDIESGGVRIHYEVEGDGPPVVLIHGFAASIELNWRAPGVIDAITKSGRKVVALDCRGHGKSEKPYEPAAYGGTKMADDAIAVMDNLGIEKADLCGYSMGGFLSASLLVRKPERFNSVILSGVGDALVAGNFPRERSEAIARAMESIEGAGPDNEVGRQFRIFAERMGNDLQALFAMQRAGRSGFDAAKLADVKLPVMVLVGEGDTLIVSAKKLAAAIPNAKYVKVPGDHLTAVGAKEFRQAIVDFLASVSPVTA